MKAARVSILAAAGIAIATTGAGALLQHHDVIGWAMVAAGGALFIGSWLMTTRRKGRDGGPYFDPEKLRMLDGPADPNGPLIETHLSEDIKVRGHYRGPPRQWLKATSSRRVQLDIDDKGESES